PAGIATGVLDVLHLNFSGGFPLNGNNPAALFGYYKYTPKNNDSCFAFAILFKWNVAQGKRDTVGFAIFVGGAQSSYTQFVAPVFPISLETPDSAIVGVLSSKGLGTAQDSSVMYVDDIGFTNSIGINSIAPKALSLYPNPADAVL